MARSYGRRGQAHVTADGTDRMGICFEHALLVEDPGWRPTKAKAEAIHAALVRWGLAARAKKPELFEIDALGATLYAMLTDDPPFTAQTPLNLIHRSLTREPDPPSKRRAGLDPRLDTICLRCLEKEPEDRYATPAAVAQDLLRFLRGDEVKPRRRRRRLRRTLVVANGVALLLVGLVVTALLTIPQEEAEPEPAQSPAKATPTTEEPSGRPRDAGEWLAQGMTRFEESRFEEALAAFERVVEAAPNGVEGLRWRGGAKLRLGDLDGARGDLDRAIEINARHPVLFYHRAEIRRAQGDLQGALEDYGRALELDPEFVAVYRDRGAVRFSYEDYEGALADWTRGLELDPDNRLILTNRGWMFTAFGKPEAGLKDLNRAIELEPREPFAWLNRGLTYEKLGDFEKALADFEQTIALAADLHEPWRGKARCLRTLGKPREAIAAANESIARKPTGPAYRARAHAKRDLGDYQGAAADYGRALDISPEWVLGYYHRAGCRVELGMFEEALEDCRTCLSYAPPDHEIVPYAQKLSAKLEARLEAEKR